MIKRLGKFLVLLLFTLILFSGCITSGGETQEYFNSAKEFNNIYFQVVDKIEINNDMKSLESLQSEENSKNIERLGELLEIIKQTVPEDREVTYITIKERFEDLIFLRDSYAKLNELNIDERRRLNRSIVMINYYKARWNDKNSNTVWE